MVLMGKVLLTVNKSIILKLMYKLIQSQPNEQHNFNET